MSSLEFSEWAAYYALEPFADDVLPVQTAVLTALLANVYRDPDRHRQAFRPEEFLPGRRDVQPEEFQPGWRARELWDRVRTWALLSGAERTMRNEHAG